MLNSVYYVFVFFIFGGVYFVCVFYGWYIVFELRYIEKFFNVTRLWMCFSDFFVMNVGFLKLFIVIVFNFFIVILYENVCLGVVILFSYRTCTFCIVICKFFSIVFNVF